MKRYLAVFTGTPEGMEAFRNLPEAERKQKEMAGVAAWRKWATDHQSSIIEMGGPLGRTKRVTESGIADVRNNLGAFTVVEADSQEAAARMFENHPHFTIFPGDGVEVMEVLPIPGQ